MLRYSFGMSRPVCADHMFNPSGTANCLGDCAVRDTQSGATDGEGNLGFADLQGVVHGKCGGCKERKDGLCQIADEVETEESCRNESRFCLKLHTHCVCKEQAEIGLSIGLRQEETCKDEGVKSEPFCEKKGHLHMENVGLDKESNMSKKKNNVSVVNMQRRLPIPGTVLRPTSGSPSSRRADFSNTFKPGFRSNVPSVSPRKRFGTVNSAVDMTSPGRNGVVVTGTNSPTFHSFGKDSCSSEPHLASPPASNESPSKSFTNTRLPLPPRNAYGSSQSIVNIFERSNPSPVRDHVKRSARHERSPHRIEKPNTKVILSTPPMRMTNREGYAHQQTERRNENIVLQGNMAVVTHVPDIDGLPIHTGMNESLKASTPIATVEHVCKLHEIYSGNNDTGHFITSSTPDKSEEKEEDEFEEASLGISMSQRQEINAHPIHRNQHLECGSSTNTMCTYVRNLTPFQPRKSVSQHNSDNERSGYEKVTVVLPEMLTSSIASAGHSHTAKQMSNVLFKSTPIETLPAHQFHPDRMLRKEPQTKSLSPICNAQRTRQSTSSYVSHSSENEASDEEENYDGKNTIPLTNPRGKRDAVYHQQTESHTEIKNLLYSSPEAHSSENDPSVLDVDPSRKPGEEHLSYSRSQYRRVSFGRKDEYVCIRDKPDMHVEICPDFNLKKVEDSYNHTFRNISTMASQVGPAYKRSETAKPSLCKRVSFEEGMVSDIKTKEGEHGENRQMVKTICERAKRSEAGTQTPLLFQTLLDVERSRMNTFCAQPNAE